MLFTNGMEKICSTTLRGLDEHRKFLKDLDMEVQCAMFVFSLEY